MMTLPDGRRVWPQFGVDSWAAIPAIRQFQLVQTELDHIEARIVGPRPLTTREAEEVTASMRARLGFPVRVSFTYLDRIDRTRSLKFEDFVSLVPEPA
jgi:phenylacetate-coenzyme A ligase PaaK-like adenylate-forming protein